MYTITAKHLDSNYFQRYGCFANMLQPTGNKIGEWPVEFYPDVQSLFFGASLTGFSTVITEKREMIVTEAERHTSTVEVLLPLDGDVIIFAAPPTENSFIREQAEAFIVPQGTLVALKAGVWHKAPFPVFKDRVSTLVILPERVYANDCTVIPLNEQKFEIIMD